MRHLTFFAAFGFACAAQLPERLVFRGVRLLCLFTAFVLIAASNASAQQPFGFTIAPATASLTAGQSAVFTVSFTGLGSTTDVIQAGVAPKIGTLSITGDVLTYTAPASVTVPSNVTLTVIPTANKSRNVTAVISLTVGVPALSAQYSFLNQIPGVAAPALAIWARVANLPPGVGCVLTYAGQETGTGIYDGAAFLSSGTPGVLLAPALSPGVVLAGAPQVSATCLGADGSSILSSTVAATAL